MGGTVPWGPELTKKEEVSRESELVTVDPMGAVASLLRHACSAKVTLQVFGQSWTKKLIQTLRMSSCIWQYPLWGALYFVGLGVPKVLPSDVALMTVALPAL